MPMTTDQLHELLFKLQFDIPIADPTFSALQRRMHLSDEGREMLAHFQRDVRTEN